MKWSQSLAGPLWAASLRCRLALLSCLRHTVPRLACRVLSTDRYPRLSFSPLSQLLRQLARPALGSRSLWQLVRLVPPPNPPSRTFSLTFSFSVSRLHPVDGVASHISRVRPLLLLFPSLPAVFLLGPLADCFLALFPIRPSFILLLRAASLGTALSSRPG